MIMTSSVDLTMSFEGTSKLHLSKSLRGQVTHPEVVPVNTLLGIDFFDFIRHKS